MQKDVSLNTFLLSSKDMEIKIVGTSHIAAQSIKEIKSAFSSFKPEIIAVELDIQRAGALMSGEKRSLSFTAITVLGVKGFLFAKIGQYIQQKLGKSVGIIPGSDMKTALELAKEHKLQVAFIDQPLQVTLQNFSKQLTWREKGRFVADIIKGLLFPKKQMREMGLDTLDLRKVPEKEFISTMMKTLQKRYPNVYKTLVEDRNKYMVKKLVQLFRSHPEKRILVVVGAGHKEGMEELLLKVDIVI
ncbi:MAG: TraB/GumN family protein [Nanoarchaeota archaeon]|nr:TraB/GumN family protein [Nanoarchaeota archaeon]